MVMSLNKIQTDRQTQPLHWTNLRYEY